MGNPAVIRKKILMIILCSGISVLCFMALSIAEEPKDTLFFAPPEGKLVDTHNMRLGGIDFVSYLYRSPLFSARIVTYYRGFSRDQGFEVTVDKEDKQAGRLLGFKKGGSAINIAVKSMGPESEVVVTKWLQPKNMSSLKEIKFSWDELVASLPETDESNGRDIAFVRRPPESIRLMSLKQPNITYLLYYSKILPAQAKEFYKVQMPKDGWEIEKETSVAQAAKELKQMEKPPDFKESLPFSGVTLEDFIKNAYIFNFKNKEGKARVALFDTNTSQRRGSFVWIEYERKQEESL